MVEPGVWMAAISLLQAGVLPPLVDKPKEKAPTVGELVVTAPSSEPPPKLNLDPRGHFGPPPDLPYLRRRPTNGCKPMAGGATHPLNKSGAAGGIVCAKAF